MNILYCSSYSLPSDRMVSTPLEIAKELYSRGVKVTILTTDLDPNFLNYKWDNIYEYEKTIILETYVENIKFCAVKISNLINNEQKYIHNNLRLIRLGKFLINQYNFSHIHLQQWQFLAWISKSAKECKIKFYYSINDYGLTCYRIFFRDFAGDICEKKATVYDCINCVKSRRSKFGNLNEILLKNKLFRKIIKTLYYIKNIEIFLNKGVFYSDIQERILFRYNLGSEIMKNASAVFVGSKYSKNKMESIYGKNIKAIINPWFSQIKAEIHTKPISKKIVVGFMGRISPEKGIETMLRAFIDFKDRDSYELKIIGCNNSKYEYSLKKKYKLLEDLGILKWIPWTSGIEKIKQISNLDILVIPSECIETGPITLYDALNLKIPVITSSAGPFQELQSLYKDYISIFSTKSESDFLSALVQASFKAKSNNMILPMPKIPNLENHVDLILTEYIKSEK